MDHSDVVEVRFRSQKPPIALYEYMALEQGFAIYALYASGFYHEQVGIWEYRQQPHSCKGLDAVELPYDLSEASERFPDDFDWSDYFESSVWNLARTLEAEWELGPAQPIARFAHSEQT